MLYSRNQTRRAERIHVASSDSRIDANSALHIAARQSPDKPEQRRRGTRQRAPITKPRAFDSMFSQSETIGPAAIWTAIDFAAAFFCSFGVTLLWHAGSMQLGVTIALMMAVSIASLSQVMHLHDLRPHRTWLQEQRLIILAVVLSAFGVDGMMHLWESAGLRKELLSVDICLTIAVMSLTRTLWRHRTARHFQRGIVTRNFIIAGADPTGCDVRDYLTSLAYLGYSFKGFVRLDEATDNPRIPSEQLLGAVDNIIPLARALFVDEIIFSHRPETQVLISTLNDARAAGINVHLVPSVSETLKNRTDVHYLSDSPLSPVQKAA